MPRALTGKELEISEAFRRRISEVVKKAEGQKELYLPAGISRSWLAGVLSGDTKNPQLIQVKLFADAAQVSVGYLLGEEGHELSQEDRASLRAIGEWLVEKFSEEEGRKLPEIATVYPDDSVRKESLVADAPRLPPGKRGDEGRDTGSRDLSTNRRREAEGEDEEDEDRP